MPTSQRISRGFHRVGLVLAALGGQTETGFTQWVIFGAIFGAIIYGIVRAIGWVISGFAAS
jgi:hypothetical protein